jgi:hypothetical protein
MIAQMRLLAAILILILSITGYAEENQKPCSTPEFRQFDFWVGAWDLTWEQDGKGTNTITRILGDCVILENFDGGDSMTLRGMSVSAFDPQSAHWRQTWVDNDGTYLDFTGAMQGENMILARTFTRAGKVLMQRMVFRDIKPDSLIWDWQRSTDQGKTWENLWTIHYRRAK